MSRPLRYTIRVRQSGEPWRVLWSGEGEQTAIDAAKALAKEMHVISAALAIPRHPYIRVSQGARLVFEVTPQSRREVA